MHFELKVNADVITRVSVIRERECPENGPGWFVYSWTAWRSDPDPNSPTIYQYANAELAHYYDDGIEELALKVLSAYRHLLGDRARETA